MAVTRLLHFVPDSGICRNQKPHKQFKYSIRRDNLDLSIDHASLLSSAHGLLAQKLTDCVKRPIFSSRYNVLKCRSSLSPDSNVTKSCMQTATMALRGPNNSLLGSPAANLVVAIGVIVFALCGLKPILRGGRKAFLHKDENSWKRSTTRHILISYLEPILLWGGAMLICRALDPVVMPTKAGRLVKIRIITFVRSLSTVLTFAYCISCAVQRAHTVFVETTEHSDAGSMGFNLAGKAVYTSVWIASISLFLELLGFSTKKWLTAGGLGTVLLTLAGREIFTNFLSSVLIQATRPFVVNEWIQTNIEGYEVSGTVEDVGWWSPTLIRGEDREAVYIPNHKFTVNIVRNLSQKTHWRIRASISISHLDVNKIHAIVADMRKVLAKNPQVEQQKLHRRVFFDNVNPENQALIILVSCFVKTSHHEEYQCVKEAILLDLLRVISHHRARLATPIRTVQNRYTDPDVDNIPFAESEYSDEVTANRPLLLINGEDFAKARLARSDVGQEDNRARGEQSSSDSVVDGKISGTEESAKSVTTTPDQGSRKPGLQPTTDSKTDSKLKEKSESQSRTGETSRSGTMASDQDSRVSVQQSKSDSKASKSGSPASAFAAKMEVKQPVISSASSQTKHIEISLPAELKPALEDNIVLEVALDGLKRGLPIDESAKEMATKRNSNEKDGSLTIKKVDKDN